MADNVQITAGSGTVINTDDCGASGHFQGVKLGYSASGTATLVTADAQGLLVNPLRIGAAVTLLSSAARTASTSSSAQTNYYNSGVLIVLDCTAASGTGGLKLSVEVSATSVKLMDEAAQTAMVTADTVGFIIHPAANPAVANADRRLRAFEQSVLPRTWQATVVHGDASSYTYSLTGYPLC